MKKVTQIAAIILILISITLIVRHSDIKYQDITAQKIKDYLLTFGIYKASVIYVVIYTFSLRPFIPVPPTLYTLAGGFTFGPVLGTLLTVIGATLNASISFGLSRLLGKDLLDKLFKGKVSKINEKLKDKGFKTVLVIRSSPIGPPFDAVSYAAGILNISFWNHFFATMIGIIPATAVYSYFGGSITKGGFYILIGFFLVVLFSVLLPRYLKKRKGKNQTI